MGTGQGSDRLSHSANTRQVEEDNSAVRDLQYIQASMIWIDVCSFCGFKRKMEIAESNLQPLVTVRSAFNAAKAGEPS